ncbi:MAG: 30S ribosomal protein S18 [candidate division WS2 bacterium]|nr:30S ribosomal protein S18 [Candidatus Lithacetigena glycinireducens]
MESKYSSGAYKHKAKVCTFCGESLKSIDYKAYSRLRRFVTEKGKILPGRVTGVCAKHQRRLAIAIKRAREMALLAFVSR